MSHQAWTWAWQQKVNSPAEKLVLLCIATFANHAGEAWPGYERIAKETAMTRRSVITQIRKLEQLGLLRVGRRRNAAQRQETNLYMLPIDGATVTISVDPGENSAPGLSEPEKPAPSEQDENIDAAPGENSAPGAGCKSRTSRVKNMHEPGATGSPEPVREPIIEPFSPETPVSVSTAARDENRVVEREGFSKLVSKWPVGARDRLAEAETLFQALAGPDKFHAVRFAPDYLEERRQAGRKVTPSLAAYLRDAPWRFWQGEAAAPTTYFIAEKSRTWDHLREIGFRGRAIESDRFKTRGRWFRRDELVDLGVDLDILLTLATGGAPP